MTEKQLKSGLRLSHRWVGLGAALLVLVSSLTGILLQHPGWLGEPAAAPSAVAIDPVDGDRWLRGNRWGVEVSDDRGATWREVPMLAPPSDVRRIAFAPDAPLTVVALGSDALVVSSDGGRVWRDVSPVPPANGPRPTPLDVGLGPHGQIALLTDLGLLESRDGGINWAWAGDGPMDPPTDLGTLVHDLHTGQWMGTPGRRLVEFGALALVFVTVTGLILYRRNGRFTRR